MRSVCSRLLRFFPSPSRVALSAHRQERQMTQRHAARSTLCAAPRALRVRAALSARVPTLRSRGACLSVATRAILVARMARRRQSTPAIPVLLAACRLTPTATIAARLGKCVARATRAMTASHVARGPSKLSMAAILRSTIPHARRLLLAVPRAKTAARTTRRHAPAALRIFAPRAWCVAPGSAPHLAPPPAAAVAVARRGQVAQWARVVRGAAAALQSPVGLAQAAPMGSSAKVDSALRAELCKLLVVQRLRLHAEKTWTARADSAPRAAPRESLVVRTASVMFLQSVTAGFVRPCSPERPNTGLDLTIPGAAQSVAGAPLCLLSGLAAQAHVGPIENRRQMSNTAVEEP